MRQFCSLPRIETLVTDSIYAECSREILGAVLLESDDLAVGAYTLGDKNQLALAERILHVIHIKALRGNVWVDSSTPT